MPVKKPKVRTIKNEYYPLLEHMGAWGPADLLEKLYAADWWDGCKKTVYRHVCKNGTPTQIDELIERRMDLAEDIRPCTGMTPLNWAIEKGNNAVIEHIVVKLKLPPDTVCAEDGAPKKPPLLIACQKLRRRAVQLLLDHGAKTEFLHSNAYEAAAGDGNLTGRRQQLVIGIWELLKKHGAPMDCVDTQWSLGHRVVANNNRLLMDWLDRNGYAWRWESKIGKTLGEEARDPEMRARIQAKEIQAATLNNMPASRPRARI